MKFFNKLIRDEAGATAIEYGLIAALIAVAAITAMQSLGNELSTTFSTVSTKMSDAHSIARCAMPMSARHSASRSPISSSSSKCSPRATWRSTPLKR